MTKRALLIGVDEYSSGEILDLDGCVNDVEAIADVLTSAYGFKDTDLKVLKTVGDTTRERILDELQALVDGVRSDDVVVVYYSGHGSQVPDRSGDEEEDGLDETIVPSDAGRGGGEVLDITDDELHSYVAALGERTPYVYFVFDSCHSGSVARDLLWSGALQQLEPRLVPRAIPPADTPPAVRPRPYRGDRAAPGAGKPSAIGLIPQGDYLMIGGCRDDQTAKETEMGGKRRGVLSYHLETELRRSSSASIGAIFERVRERVEESATEQDPVLEAPDRLEKAIAFGGADAAPARPLPAAEPDAGDDGGSDDDNGGGKAKSVIHEWDGRFAVGSALLVLALLVLGAGSIGAMTWWVLDNGADGLEVSLIVILGLLVIGLLLAGLGSYMGLLEARGRAHVLAKLPEPDAGRGFASGGVADFTKELKGIFEQLGKMPTARALIAIGAVAFVAAAAFAWHVVPNLAAEDPPSIAVQPQALTVEPRGKALFRVSASGDGLRYEWQRNGTAIPDADTATYFIPAAAEAEDGDLFAVKVSNQAGEVVSEDVELTVAASKGPKVAQAPAATGSSSAAPP
jgi:hypothetical protein